MKLAAFGLLYHSYFLRQTLMAVAAQTLCAAEMQSLTYHIDHPERLEVWKVLHCQPYYSGEANRSFWAASLQEIQDRRLLLDMP
jgi:hypothetical protein